MSDSPSPSDSASNSAADSSEAAPPSDAIEVLLSEDRTFPPPADFAADAHINSVEQYEQMWQRAKDDPAGFWGELAQSELDWMQPFDEVMSGDMPDTTWFAGGQTNACHNCVDRRTRWCRAYRRT